MLQIDNGASYNSIINCDSYYNTDPTDYADADGFAQNNNKGSMILYNCTGHNNIVADYRITQTLAEVKVAELGGFAEQAANSWLPPFVISSEDFISISETSAYGQRNVDGNLPDIDYMHLAVGSDLIDVGVDVGLPFSGDSPDLGCFETLSTAVDETSDRPDFILYPNPSDESGTLEFTLEAGGKCVVELMNSSGKQLKTLVNSNLEAGIHILIMNLADIPEGIYICRARLNGIPIFSAKLIKRN